MDGCAAGKKKKKSRARSQTNIFKNRKGTKEKGSRWAFLHTSIIIPVNHLLTDNEKLSRGETPSRCPVIGRFRLRFCFSASPPLRRFVTHSNTPPLPSHGLRCFLTTTSADTESSAIVSSVHTSRHCMAAGTATATAREARRAERRTKSA